MNSLYADGLRNIILRNGIIQIDFGYNVAKSQDKNETENTAIINLPILGFLQTYQEMTKFISTMEEKGVIKKDAPKAE
jgi:hypothetical protein